MRKIFTSLASIVVCGLALSSGAFADANLTFEVVVPDETLIEISLLNSNGSALSGNTSIDLTPTTISGSFFNEKNMTVNVGTNNEWGYNLVMSVSNTSLISTEDGSKTIPTLTAKDGGYTCTVDTANTCDFTANTWGYKLNAATNLSAATNYLPLQSSITLNNNSNKVLTPEATSVAFGSKVNADLAPGTYSTTINFIATANPDPTPIMQNVSASDLASLMPSSGSTTTVKDERDGTKYTIGKLADGNYWMLDNLALDLTDSTVLNNLSKMNTNATTTSIESLQHGARSAGDQYATAGVSNWTTSYSYSAPLVNASYKDQTQPLAAGQSGTGKIGVYYNYCAATAGSYCYGNGTSGGSPTTDTATEDICPKGWRMPTGGSSGEYQALYTVYSSNAANFVNALKTPLSSDFYNGSALSQGSSGFFWSSTYESATYMYNLFVGTSSVYPQNVNNRNSGNSVRCLFDIPTMQSVTNGTLAEKMPTSGSTTVLKDSRDGNNYQITNVNGTYWMTDNLRFTGTSLTPTDTNVTQNTTMSYTDLSLGNDSTVARMHYDTTDPNSNIYGAYYNVCAASAGTLCNETTSANITSDICPKGWKMPTEANAQALKNSGVDWNPIAAGFYGGGSLSSGSMGYWWLSTGGSGVGAWTTYRMLYYTSNNNLIVSGDGSRWYGGSIRCVAGS